MAWHQYGTARPIQVKCYLRLASNGRACAPSRDIALMGGDTSSNDAQPSGEKGDRFAVHCHTEMQTRRGIWNLENMDLKPLVDAKVYEFAFIWAPLKIIGGTGSPGNPIAIY